MPRKLYPSGEGALDRRRYVTTGAHRPPKAGELYLSGAIPAVYTARADMEDAREIMREASPDEATCHACGQRAPDADTPRGCENDGDGQEHYAMGHRVEVRAIDEALGCVVGPVEIKRLCTKCCDRTKRAGYYVRNA